MNEQLENECPIRHECAQCHRQWTHGRFSTDECPYREISGLRCGECCEYTSLGGERYLDDFRDWAMKVRRKAGVSNG